MSEGIVSGYDNPIYIQLCLSEIQIIKQLFVFQVELGDEAIIPPALLQKNISHCYKFYNPILRIIEEHCQDQKKNLFIQRNS